ncbi:MAG: hypothetical protein ACOCRK_08335 [bacterium]
MTHKKMLELGYKLVETTETHFIYSRPNKYRGTNEAIYPREYTTKNVEKELIEFLMK